MIVALIALFVALGGSVYAAARINGHRIDFGSLPGNRIKDDSVTGRQVRESSLGKVRNADTLDGIDSTAFSHAASRAIASNAIPPSPTGDIHNGVARQIRVVAPQDGFVLAIASAEAFNNNDVDDFRCILRLDNVDQQPSLRSGHVDFNLDQPRDNCDTTSLLPVTKGSHTVQFFFADLDNTTVVDAAELDLVFIPFG
jgi:hypothetical protein